MYLPWLSVERFQKQFDCARTDERPLILVRRTGSRRVISALNGQAIKLGLRPGMPAAKAQALVPDLRIADADDRADLEALNKLALWALGIYAPIVAVDGMDGIVIETTGSDHLHGSETDMATSIVERLKRAGLTAKCVVADTWGAAHAVARFGGRAVSIIPQAETARSLVNLPLPALRLAPTICQGLNQMGFETIGEVSAQPRAPLALRFGSELGRRLDQAFGRIAEPIEPIRVLETPSVSRNFAEPIGAAETIQRYAGKLIDQLVAILRETGLGARRVDLICNKVDGTQSAVRVGLQQPSRDGKRLFKLLSDKIDKIEPGFGIEIMTLVATAVEELDDKQAPSALVGEQIADVSDLIDTLANRVGPSRIFGIAPVASDVPERAFRRVSANHQHTGEIWRNDWPRPVRLFDTPVPIEAIAMLPDNPPASFTWKGTRHRVKCADGPERVFGEWWRRDAELTAVRDYFQVENENGERFWIYRSGDGEHADTGNRKWFLHGIFA